jgi:hypothetical protein
VDIKNKRRDAQLTGKWTDRDLPPAEGDYPAGGKKGHGNAASDNNVGWDIRSQSWQRGADTNYQAIDAEKREQSLRFGVPYEDNFPDPSDPSGPPNCGARYQTASYDGDAALSNPHNFSSNPGFMGTSSADMSRTGGPANGGTATITTPGSGRSLRGTNAGGQGTVGMTASHRTSSASLPAPGDIDPGQEGGPQVVSTGFGPT